MLTCDVIHVTCFPVAPSAAVAQETTPPAGKIVHICRGLDIEKLVRKVEIRKRSNSADLFKIIVKLTDNLQIQSERQGEKTWNFCHEILLH